MSELPLKATLKAGKDYDAPWLTVDGTNPDDLHNKLVGLAESGVLQALVETANALKAANNAAPLLGGGGIHDGALAPQQAAPAPAPAWGQSASGTNGPPPQQFQQPAQQPQQQGFTRQATTHPEGLACACGKVLEYGKTRTNKGQWKCPDYRWNNGNPNDHRLEWAS